MKNDYSQLHDAQINMMVCKVLGLGLSSYARIMKCDDATVLLDDNKTLVDYCNNWADVGPIVVKNGISLINHWDSEDEDLEATIWSATTNVDKTWCDSRSKGFDSTHKNPLRAAMIVFLEMQK